MKKINTGASLIISSLLFIHCNNSANGGNQTDSALQRPDTVPAKIVVEGGLKDSLAIGASDTTKEKDSAKK